MFVLPFSRSGRRAQVGRALLLTGMLSLLCLPGCSPQSDTGSLDMATADLMPEATYKIHVVIALDADAMGEVSIRAQNGAMVTIPTAMIVGKNIGWVILKGGDQVANGQMLEVGGGMIDDQLRSDFTTKMSYPDGAYELALLILLASPDLAHAPTPGDLAAFSVVPPPPDQPPLTGNSVRVTIADADARVALDNFYFIQL